MSRFSFRPAELADLVALYPRLMRRRWQVLSLQVMTYPAWTFCVDDVPAALCGCAPCGPGCFELWLSLPPDFRKARWRQSAIRLILTRAAVFLPEFTLVVRIHDANRRGQAMASMTGFEPTDELIEVSQIRTWRRAPVIALLTGNRTFFDAP